MERVSQDNAANAEETAASAEQIEVEGEVLNELVGYLLVLAGGQVRSDRAPDPPTVQPPHSPVRVWVEPTADRRAPRPGGARRIEGASRLQLPAGGSAEDGDFRDF